MPFGALGLVALGLAYFMSQFYRSFLAVLYQPLASELSITEAAAADAQSAWWLVFAAAQFPIGWALDTIGPRRTATALLGVAGTGGCLLFAYATNATELTIAMGAIGLGCAPVLMSSYYIFARQFDPQRFAFYAAMLIGLGTLGNVAASEPLAALERVIGWRNTAIALAAVALCISIAILAFVKDPPKVRAAGPSGGFMELFRIRALWLILPLVMVNYAAAANLRSPWSGTFYPSVFALEGDAKDQIVGQATFWMALAMAAGTFMYGPLDRIFGSRKMIVLAGNGVVVGLLTWLAVATGNGLTLAGAMLLFALIGGFGHTYPIVMAHGQAFLPPNLVGRGMTFLNFFSIGGAAVMQSASARVFVAASDPADPSAGYVGLFIFYAAALSAGLAIYAFSTEKNPPLSYWARRRAASATKDAS
ncbi:MAG: MFS transporter [Neomegalonema sp.]|nr:MFS transporter [Neomegalonema sp.]